MKLMVIDGNSIINRAYYGIRPLSTRVGRYGFILGHSVKGSRRAAGGKAYRIR